MRYTRSFLESAGVHGGSDRDAADWGDRRLVRLLASQRARLPPRRAPHVPRHLLRRARHDRLPRLRLPGARGDQPAAAGPLPQIVSASYRGTRALVPWEPQALVSESGPWALRILPNIAQHPNSGSFWWAITQVNEFPPPQDFNTCPLSDCSPAGAMFPSWTTRLASATAGPTSSRGSGSGSRRSPPSSCSAPPPTSPMKKTTTDFRCSY